MKTPESLPAAPVEAAQPSDEPRFFIEHDTIHDRLTGRHVHGQRDFDPGSADAAVAMLNDLHRKAALFDAAPPGVLVEPAKPLAWFVDGNQGGEFSSRPNWFEVQPGDPMWSDNWTRYPLYAAPAVPLGGTEETAPIDMVLHCPRCGRQHIDAPDSDAAYTAQLHESSWWELGGDKPERWTNPPHRSHKCHGCGRIWRPADVPTNGVAAVKTVGKADSPIATP